MNNFWVLYAAPIVPVALIGGVMVAMGWLLAHLEGTESGDRFGGRMALVGLIVVLLCWAWPLLALGLLAVIVYGVVQVGLWAWEASGAEEWWVDRRLRKG